MNSLFDSTFVDNGAEKTLVLLHGTGGTKSDFLFFDKATKGAFNLLGVQGNVVQDGMTRFFKRITQDTFDQDNIREEADKLKTFLTTWASEHGQELGDLIVLGYSNGANMILATLFHHPESIHTAVLLHPRLPFVPENIALQGKSLFVSTGENDPWVSPEQQAELTTLLSENGAEVRHEHYRSGHDLTQPELKDVLTFLQNT